jgi:hypothetical protein
MAALFDNQIPFPPTPDDGVRHAVFFTGKLLSIVEIGLYASTCMVGEPCRRAVEAFVISAIRG